MVAYPSGISMIRWWIAAARAASGLLPWSAGEIRFAGDDLRGVGVRGTARRVRKALTGKQAPGKKGKKK